MNLLISLSHDGLGHIIVGGIYRCCHCPDQHISVIPIVIHGRHQSLFSCWGNVLLWDSPLLHLWSWFIKLCIYNAGSIWRSVLIGTRIAVHYLILGENTSGSICSGHAYPIRIAAFHVLRMRLVVVCPNVAIEVLVYPTCYSCSADISFVPRLRLPQGWLISSAWIHHFRR